MSTCAQKISRDNSSTNYGAHRGLEHEEEVRGIVRIDRLAVRTEVLAAIRAAKPLAVDALHAPVAERRGVAQREEVRCTAGQSSYHADDGQMHLEGSRDQSSRPERGPQDYGTYAR